MPISTDISSVVAVYATHAQADDAVKELQRSGFDMTKLSIIGQDYHTEENVTGYYTLGDDLGFKETTGGRITVMRSKFSPTARRRSAASPNAT